MLIANRKREISVIIVCCEAYHGYLRAALDSVLKQSIQPDEILIVYDKTEPSITTHSYIQTNNGHPLASRRDGFEATTKEVVCFLDADDFISKDYIASGLALKTGNNIVYSDVHLFGSEDKLLRYSPKYMSQENYLHVASLVSRDSINIANAFTPIPPHDCHEDWVFWRRLLKAGCPTIKQTGVHFHREHEQCRSRTITPLKFHTAKGVRCDTIGIVRVDGKEHDSRILLEWPTDQTELHIINEPDIREINKIINTTNADYLLFYSDPDILLNPMVVNLDYGIIAVQCKNLLPWHGTLVVVDMLRSQTPFYSFDGEIVLI